MYNDITAKVDLEAIQETSNTIDTIIKNLDDVSTGYKHVSN
jgi:hypothetical protein